MFYAIFASTILLGIALESRAGQFISGRLVSGRVACLFSMNFKQRNSFAT